MEVRENGKGFEVALDRWNTVAFRIESNAAGYLQVAPWNDYGEGTGDFADPMFSLRSTVDVVRFCQVLALAIPLRAQRKAWEK
jgi:hypothetical protein